MTVVSRERASTLKAKTTKGNRSVALSLDDYEEIIDEFQGIKVTLSGLLNFIDAIWSTCGEERIIVFTTNHVGKLDPALIRTGRMDKHIELSYCGFEAFKVLAKNYLNHESHHLFKKIRTLLEKTRMTPADVAENWKRACRMEMRMRRESLIKKNQMIGNMGVRAMELQMKSDSLSN
ncbi:hypothetical protein ACH5RR_033217 [Cinchona calisaya]|uniref:ATPase AAA-type core domain-containing protein n=1 Tax=Cinchona calisaya TaxID=153742 RepID=A0ABD2YPE3_9GENT